MGFPTIRPRRLRATPFIRSLVQETYLAPSQLIYPLFFSDSIDKGEPIKNMPNQIRHPVREARQQAKELVSRGIKGALLFGLPTTKDAYGTSAYDPDGPVPRALAEMKNAAPDLYLMTDVCVDAYTDHGHCGLLKSSTSPHLNGFEIDNDSTLEVLAKVAVTHARAGADMVAPSAMMDGQVSAIRQALDQEGHNPTAIMSYAVKYASAFYAPFRDAADCKPQFGDRASYQLPPSNQREALREAALDEAEGADILLVKPGLLCLDVIRTLSESTYLPIAAYHVSGEYAMLHASAAHKILPLERAVLEVLTAIRRAGANFVITYHALEAAEWLYS
ncbi:porphobilinogen synthase [Pajaroellobacter abortibovis]|uniref:Delta-aminolevulinic acid dehydratase n=1 Tax=Pajaroellobacter abortibovis TaxID=1882918 RepID=A0A1L6MVG1_9BACT|nr:porphobilinogen synthase [Pajaroellobacter abortibovis]APR99533.1 delta-aminolevulinic acid dehydratase [Pajaroellobacter abortibovis]